MIIAKPDNTANPLLSRGALQQRISGIKEGARDPLVRRGQITMKMQTIRNFLMVFGCYWLSLWVVLPIAIIHGKITYGIIYTGTLGALRIHTVSAIPLAIVSFGAGMLLRYVLEDPSPKYWIPLLALLYASKHFMGVHWAIPPELSDRALQLPQSILPAITCYMGSKIPIKTTR